MDTLLTYAEQYQTEIVVVGGALILILLGWLTFRAIQHHRRQRLTERPTGRVRRPLYTDVALLDDIRAHGDPTRTAPASTATTTASDATHTSLRTDETRRLNDTMTELAGSSVLTDLDADPDADLEVGKAVVLTGRLERHPASDAAEILELSAPLLQRGSTNGHGRPSSDGDTTTVPRIRAGEVTAEAAPLVVRLHHPSAKRGYLMVLPRENLRVDDPFRAGESVTVLGVVEAVLGRRDTLAVEDYLGPHLSTEGQGMLADRDLGETIAALSDVANEDLAARDLPFRGPGALLTPASIYR